ncbi:hypothetical protein [Vibrio gangliei]|uniref:hypothetical protein n=1 Tax=Vibrio gangliei TaxID=2077090 RepID=UPI000D01B743|nr:hypothetical protein [Vibrio gangliei]
MDNSLIDVFPYIAGALKLIVLGIGAYFAIKWHFDEDRRLREEAGEILDRPSLIKKVLQVLIFVILLISIVLLVIYLTNQLLY